MVVLKYELKERIQLQMQPFGQMQPLNILKSAELFGASNVSVLPSRVGATPKSTQIIRQRVTRH